MITEAQAAARLKALGIEAARVESRGSDTFFIDVPLAAIGIADDDEAEVIYHKIVDAGWDTRLGGYTNPTPHGMIFTAVIAFYDRRKIADDKESS